MAKEEFLEFEGNKIKLISSIVSYGTFVEIANPPQNVIDFFAIVALFPPQIKQETYKWEIQPNILVSTIKSWVIKLYVKRKE